jgi:hypothetical protein
MSHSCRYKGGRWLVFSFRRSAAILSNRVNQTRSREPTPSRDLQTAFVREAASPAHRTPFAWLADRSDQYGHGMPCPISRTPFAGMADRPDQSTGTAYRAPSAGRRLRGWRTARIRVRARHAVPHQPDAVCGDGGPPGSEYGHGMPCLMTQRRCNGTMPVPRDAMQQLLKRCLPVTRRAAPDLMPHPPPRPPPHSGTRGDSGVCRRRWRCGLLDRRTGETRGVRP